MRSYVVEAGRVGGKIILHEEPFNRSILDLLVLGKMPIRKSRRRKGQKRRDGSKLHDARSSIANAQVKMGKRASLYLMTPDTWPI